MQLKFTWQLQLGDAPQILVQDFFLDFELMAVAGVLVLASAATFEVSAAGLDTMWRGLDDCFDLRTREAGLLLGEFRLNLFPIQHERDEYSLAASVGVRRQAGQTIATVD